MENCDPSAITAPLVSDDRSASSALRAELGIRHDHGRQRFAERRLDRGLPPRIDLDQLEQRAEHAVDALQAFGAGTSPSSVERHLERLDTSRGRGGGVGGLGSFGPRRLHDRVGSGECVLGGGELIEERPFDGTGFVALGAEPVRPHRPRAADVRSTTRGDWSHAAGRRATARAPP